MSLQEGFWGSGTTSTRPNAGRQGLGVIHRPRILWILGCLPVSAGRTVGPVSHPSRRRAAMAIVARAALGGPVSTVRLREAGLTVGQIRAAVHGGELLALRRDIVITTRLWRDTTDDGRVLLAARAALLVHPTGAVSHETAARLLGLPTTRKIPLLDAQGIPIIHITRDGHRRTVDWLEVHGGVLTEDEVSSSGVIRRTSIIRTAIDMARTTRFPFAVATMDAAHRAMTISVARSREPWLGERVAVLQSNARTEAGSRIRQAIEAQAATHGMSRAARAASWADPGSETVLESLSRVRIRKARLPLPECGQMVIGASGRTYWVDKLWRAQRVIGEDDGMLKYVTGDDLIKEKLRQEDLESAGYRFVRCGWHDVNTDPRPWLARVRRALAAGAAPPRVWAG